MNKLEKALAAFEDETLDLTLSERISGIREALIFTTFRKMQEIHRDRTLDKEAAAKEEAKYIEVMKWFRELEKLYSSQIRMNKLTGKKDDNMEKNFLKRVKELKGSMSDIVRSIHSGNGENKN